MISATCAPSSSRGSPSWVSAGTHARGSSAEDRAADRLGELKADREAQPPVTAEGEQLVRRARRVGPDEDLLARRHAPGQLRERGVERRDLVRGGVGAGVARPQHARQRLPA